MFADVYFSFRTTQLTQVNCCSVLYSVVLQFYNWCTYREVITQFRPWLWTTHLLLTVSTLFFTRNFNYWYSNFYYLFSLLLLCYSFFPVICFEFHLHLLSKTTISKNWIIYNIILLFTVVYVVLLPKYFALHSHLWFNNIDK